MEYRDVLGAHLREDARVKGKTLFRKRIFNHDMYELHIIVWQGIAGHATQGADLVTAMTVYKKEGLRIMLKLWTVEGQKDFEKYLADYVLDKIQAELKSPLHIIRDAKKWCSIPLTEADQITLLQAGITA